MDYGTRRGFPYWILWPPVVATELLTHHWTWAIGTSALTVGMWWQWHRRWPVWAPVKLRWQLRHLDQGEPPVGFWSRREVMERDGRRCVFCSRSRRLRVCLIVPAQYGGSYRYDQVATLCEHCYLVKADYYPGRVYHPRTGFDSARQAAGIYAAMYNHIRACQKATIV